MDAKHLVEMSSKSIGTGHPGVFMLVPTKAGKAAEVVARPRPTGGPSPPGASWSPAAKTPPTSAWASTSWATPRPSEQEEGIATDEHR